MLDVVAGRGRLRRPTASLGPQLTDDIVYYITCVSAQPPTFHVSMLRTLCITLSYFAPAQGLGLGQARGRGF
eukprot:6756138-Pyramimonas_sp.AAC.1